MSSSVLPARSNRMSAATLQPTSNYVPVPGYPHNPQSPYVLVSPVLVPFIENLGRSSKSKSKKGKKLMATPKVRFVPALTYAAAPSQCLYYNTSSATFVKGVQSTVGHLGVSPYPLPIHSEASRLSQGYISALSALSSSYGAVPYNAAAVQSDLNPLSRPYTPSSRMQSDAVTLNPLRRETLGERLSRKRAENLLSGRSSPENWSELSSELSSRGSTPISTTCPNCRNGKQSNNSDADSGVGGESDDEGSWCMCDVTSSSSEHPGWEEEEPFDFNFRYKKDAEKLSESTLALIEFLCSHLNFQEWRTVARELGVSDVIIQNADYDDFENPHEQMKSIFCLWANSVQALPYEEQCLQVESALREIGRRDVIEKIASLQKNGPEM